ncbi:MAG: hypothetical protein GWP04_05055 [Gammaproteobacteria bacterium]|nr:hypothetical protein [Gammaproteobacteria bacterium]
MRVEPTDSADGRPRRSINAALGILVGAVILVLATWYASSATTQRVAANAESLHWTNATLGAVSIARASNGQAVFFAVDGSEGVASAEAVDRALGEAEKNVAALESLISRASGEIAAPRQNLVAYVADSRSLLSMLRSGEIVEAAEFNQTHMEDSYQILSVELTEAQDETLGQIANSQQASARASSIISFLGMFLLPGSALVVYWWIVRRQVRERRMRMQLELQAANELNEAKDQFIAGLSHELRTPLTGIVGFTQVLGEMCRGNVEMEELVGLIGSEATELSRMVEDVLVAARIGAGAITFAIEDLTLADEVETVTRPFIKDGRSVTVSLRNIEVRADRLRVRQVLRNLIANAVKHGGPHIRVEGEEKAGMVLCRVMDDGPGISDDIKNRLFDRFAHDGREALLAGSVGLGLTIARSLARSMGGDVSFEEREGWTTFVMTLPKPVSEMFGPDLFDPAVTSVVTG